MKKIILIILMSFSSFLGFSQLNEGFEGAPLNPDASGVWALPSSGNWLIRDNRTNSGVNWKKNVIPFVANTGSDAALVDRENTGANVYAEEWLITPQISILANSQLRFFTRQTLEGDTGTKYQVRVSANVDQANLGAYTVLIEYTETELSALTANQLDYEEKVINLPTAAGARYFAFVKVFTQPGPMTSGDRWLIDDVKIVQRCFDPTVLTASDFTATNATLSWTGTSPQYTVEYGVSGFLPGTGAGVVPPVTGILAPTYTIPPGTLLPSTSYQYYVTGVCTNSVSQVTGPFNFNTTPLGSTCGAPIVVPGLPYSSTSNTNIYGNNVSAVSPGATGCGTTGAFIGGSDVVYSFTPTTTGVISITMDPLTNTNTGVFVYSSCANVGISCIAGVGNATSTIREITSLNVTAGVPIFILLSSTTATASYPYVLTIQTVNCPAPINLASGPFTTTSGTLSWTNGTGSTATSWEVAVQTAGSAIPAGSGVQTNNNTAFPVAGLTEATAYQFWVRADCGDGTFSTWSGPFLFNTTICDVIGCNYTFTMTDSFGDGWNGATMLVRQNGITIQTIGPTFTGGDGPVVVSVPLCNNIPFDLFWNTGGGFPGEVRVAITNSFGQPIYSLSVSNAPLVGTILYAGTVDCFNPLCLVPTNVNVPVGTITTNGAVINWTSSGVPTSGWDVYLVPTGTLAPTATTIPTATVLAPTATYVASGLLADMIYDVYIRSVCTVNGPSEWTTVTSFTTLPTCPKPINILIPTVTITQTEAVINWTNVGPGTSWQVAVLPSPSTPPTSTSLVWSAPLAVTTYTISTLTSGTIYDVYVRAICPGNDIGSAAGPVSFNTLICADLQKCNYTFTLTDSFGDGWNGATMQVRQNGIVVGVIGPTFTAGDGPVLVTVALCTGVPFDLYWNTAGGFPAEVRVAINNSFGQELYNMSVASPGLVGTAVYVSTGADCLDPLCLPPIGLTTTAINIFDATLDWTPIVGNNSWQIYNVLTGTAPPTSTTIPTHTTAIHPFQLTDLSAGTTYQYYVQAECTANSPSGWAGPFEYTTLPTCPQPINLSVLGTNENSAALTWTEVGPATVWEIVFQPIDTGIPTGPGNPVTFTNYNTLTGPGGAPLAPGFYEFYVRSICTDTDQSFWSGPVSFFIATALPVCASVDINVETTSEGVIDFCPGENCVDLEASFTDSGDTTTYEVLPIAFAPPFPFTGGTEVSVDTDDIWSNPITLPFNFCFYGINYPSIQIGSNGVLTFNPQVAPGNCAWNTVPGQVIPNPAFPILNAIYGVYQDIDPSEDTAPLPSNINFQILGTAPCRTFVVNYFQVGQFQCGVDVGLQTSQIVLYETSNIIEVYVQDRTACAWNDGLGVIGIQNTAGTLAHFPPGRNLGNWETQNEAWRFTPDGASNVAFSWLKNGEFLSSNPVINVCVTETTLMTAQAVYTGCGGQIVTETEDVLLRINTIDVLPVEDVSSCEPYSLPELTVGNYFTQPGGVGPIDITEPITTSQTIYVYGATPTTPACTDEESFTVTINGFPPLEILNVSECESYTLPPLDPPFNYYAEQGGVTPIDILIPITASQFIFVFAQVGECIAESAFNVTIGSVEAFEQEDVVECTSFTLPALSPLYNSYYTQPGGPTGTGTLIPVGTVITTNQNIYIYAQSSTCIDESEFSITITNTITPTFLPIANVCLNSSAPILPFISENGISGTWTPPVVDTSVAGTVTYTFTPDGVVTCAIPTTIDVTIDTEITPTFLPVADTCLNGTAPLLPLTSENGIVGTWLPPTILTTTVGTSIYTFTPDVTEACAISTTLSVTINSEITPVFLPIPNVCLNAPAPILQGTSENGVTGTWTPSVVDTSVAGQVCYTFTPEASQSCAITASLCITVDGEITPIFAPIANVCLNNTAPVLPLVSDNSVSGTWLPPVVDTSVAGTVTYTFTPDGVISCAIPTTINVTIDELVTPIFIPIADVCLNATAPILPLTSENGITGTWVPASVDTSVSGTVTYTFTPDGVIPCTLSTTINVTVNSEITPLFAPIANVCQNTLAPLLQSTSQNGVTGIWSPSFVDTSLVGQVCYTFTPDASQSCAISTSLCVTVDSEITPLFTPIANVCLNGLAPLLPLTSDNGITGTWSPTFVDTTVAGTLTYTFTPDGVILCTIPTTITVTVDLPIIPNFVITSVICSGTTAPTLDATSPNGVNGTWTPPTIDNLANGSYTFTPDAGQCATTQIVSVSVTPLTTPTFVPIADFCAGTTAPILGLVSANGITGTWTPSIISNTGSDCYVFTPDANQCATTQTLCVVVLPNQIPDFAPIASICSGDTAPSLSGTSPNGVAGTWSPAVISNTESGSYTFTPTSSICSSTQTLEVTVSGNPQFRINGGCNGTVYQLVIEALDGFDPELASYSWTSPAGQPIAGNTSTITASSTGLYTCVVTYQGCSSTETITVNSISCTIQKGISPGDGGKNNFFDLDGLNVKQLSIFNRYGLKVYSLNNYTNQWFGQTDDGKELPDGTYYYVIDRDNVEPKTGWIYINRVK